METIRTRIWQEEAEPDNAFTALSCHCHGYDIYSELLKQANWIEYLFFL
jgi:citrate synthase